MEHNLNFDHLPDTLLVTRKQARKLLGGISNAVIIRLENEGELKPIRFGRSPSTTVFYRFRQVWRLTRDGVTP